MNDIKIIGGELEQGELDAYKEVAVLKCPRKKLIQITIDGDYVNLEFEPVPFERIRRITGYLVGNTTRWNPAKQAELRDRVKHEAD